MDDCLKKKFKKICEYCSLKEITREKVAVYMESVGFSLPEKAARDLISLKEKLKGFNDWESILPMIFLSFDPDRALDNLLRFSDQISPPFWNSFAGNQDALDVYFAVFSGSQHLTDILLGQWDELCRFWSRWYLPCDEFSIKSDLEKRIEDAEGTSAVLDAVRCFKNRWYLNIGARDLLRLDSTEIVMRRLSLVADICLDVIYDLCYRELEKKHGTPMEVDEGGREKKSTGVILGMGKLGGEELNFSSDIDLIFLYSSDKGETFALKETTRFSSAFLSVHPRGIYNHEFFTLLAQKITRIIGQKLKIFRVDLDLRPEGRSGAITQPLSGAEIYYESWGQTWERMAMIKVRPVAGDGELGKRFLETIRPFVYRKYLGESAFDEIRMMRNRIKEKFLLEKKDRPENVKLGDGGIREIEFIVQAFQLLYGGRIKKFQTPVTLRILRELSHHGMLPAAEAEDLRFAYLFLRDTENRIQMLHGQQSHLLPCDCREQVALSKKMGLIMPGNAGRWISFMKQYRFHTEKVKEIFNKLFTTSSPPTPRLPQRKSYQDKFSLSLSQEEQLTDKSFKNPDKIRSLVSLLKNGPPFEYPTLKAKELFDRLLPSLLVQIKSQPEPERILIRFEEFTRGFGAREVLFSFLLENKPILELLIRILGTGGILCERLVQFHGFLDLISRSDTFREEKSLLQMRKEIKKIIPVTSSTGEKLDLLAKYKVEEEFRIGFRLITKDPEPLPIFEELSHLAQLYLERIFFLACQEVFPDDPSLLAGKIAIIALGKFGGKELDFGSDLDIVFVSLESEEKEDSVCCHRVCQKIMELSQTVTRYGVPYRIDLDLRPFGSSGPLVVSLSGFQKYYREKARSWERMAWIRSRVIGEEREGISQIQDIIADFVYNRGLDETVLYEIEQVWRQVHREKRASRKGRVNLKFGSGGLFDLEFITQLFQLKWGAVFPDIRQAHTFKALSALERSGCLPAETVEKLKNAYVFLRNLESSQRLTHDYSGDWIGLSDEQWEILSKRMRIYPHSTNKSGKYLQKTFQAVTADINRIKSDIGILFK